MIQAALKSRADFIVRTDETGREVLKTSRSLVLVPKTRWNGKGIKWAKEKKKADTQRK